jgi:hypothetical protein
MGTHPDDPRNFIDDVRARQRNVVFPDTVRNARAVYEFLWKGSPNPGAWLVGLTFIVKGAASLRWSPLQVLFSFAWILIGAKVFSLGFRKRKSQNGD